MLSLMSLPFIYTLLSVLAISLVSLIGLFGLSLKERALKTSLFALVSLAVGALLGDAFIHLIPEAFAEGTNALMVSLAIVGGVLAFFVIEKALHWHHHQGIEDVEHGTKPVGKLILISDGFHNFIDGIIIGASYLVSPEVGVATTIAVILHEIPQEIGDFGVLIHAGFSRAKALWYNFLSALFAVAGAILVFVLGSNIEGIVVFMVPIAAGGFIYIALSDLIPELHNQADKSARHAILQFFWIIIGVLLMVLLLGVEGESHSHGDEPHAEETHEVDELLHEDEHGHELDLHLEEAH